VVIAVDGRNIISGKKSHLKNSEPMYIINRYEVARHEGWRTDSKTVHRFYFTNIDDSYSMRTFSDSSAMGVIAVAVFREKDRPRQLYKKESRRNAPAARAAEMSPEGEASKFRDDRAGTGFGDQKHSPTIKGCIQA
jgi:hypothetical protein